MAKMKVSLVVSDNSIIYEAETDEKPVQTTISEKNREIIKESYPELEHMRLELQEMFHRFLDSVDAIHAISKNTEEKE